MSFPYKNPISPVQIIGSESVSRDKTFGTNYSTLSVGGYMEVFSLDQLKYTIPTLTYGSINYSGNSIPITFSVGSGTTFSYDTLTLNPDNISSGRKKLGMLVYVKDEDQIYQFNINNYETLWNAATGATGTVVISNFGTTVKANTPEGIAFISGWTANTIDGISGETQSTAVWKKYYGSNLSVTGGTYSSGTLTLKNITGGTISITGFSGGGGGGDSITGGTIDYSTGTLSLNSSGGTVSITGFTDTFVTGATYDNANKLTFTNNTGGTFNVLFNTLTGLTINGDLVVTGNTDTNLLSASTINIKTTPNTNTTDTDVLVRNSITGDIENRSISNLLITNNTIIVALTGSTTADFNSIKDAVNSITGATSANTYTVKVAGGIYYEDPFTIPSWVAVRGDSSISTVIQANDSTQTLIRLSDQSGIFDCQVQGCTDTGVSAIVYSSSTTPQSSAISYVENVRFGSNYTHAKVVAYGGANIIMQCSNVKYGGYPFTIGFYATNSGSGVGRMQLRNVTSTNGGIVTTPGLIFAKADATNCGFIVNGCLLTKAVGAAAGTGFYVENGGFLRLTAVNFQRWEVGIDAPQIGSAPSIDAIALNFENNTIDVNISHSGATGKIQGTDNFLKTIINQNSPLYEVNQDPKEITVAKKGGDFSSIKSAVDYLIASGNTSSTNRYVISVGPGEFTEGEIDLTQTPYVSIVGSNIQTTLIKPSGNTQNIINIGINNEISFLTLSGAPSGYAAIYCYDIGDFAQAHKLSMYDCDTNIWVESNTQDTKFYGEYIDYNGEYTYGTKVIGNNGYVALANMENYFNFPTGTNITYSNYATGSGATINAFVSDNVSNGISGTTAFYIQDGAQLNASTVTSDGNTYGIRNPNIGLPIRFDVDNASFVDGEWDLYVERIGTFGTLGGSSNHQKIFTVSDDVYWAFLDIDDGEFDITRKASVTFTDGSHTDFTTLIFEGSSMGLLSGGSLTTISGFTVQADGGFGYLEKSDDSGIVRRIDWLNNQITLSANTDNYIYINENSNLVSSGTRPITSYNILLGRVVTDSTGVEFIDLTPMNAEHTSNSFDSLFTMALGPIYANGSIVTEGTTPFTLDVTQGDYHFSTNEFLPSGGTPITFSQYYRNGTGSTWITTATTLVNNIQYDNNGTLTGLTAGYFTKHTLYTVGDGTYENYFLVLGQNEYSTLVQTENALLPTPPTYFTDGVVQIANIYVQQGTTGITQIEDIRPTIAFRAGGVNASSVHGNLLGLNADDHTQYLLVSGARAMSGNLDMGTNDITNVGTVDGVTVSSHATRHQFGGLDPVGTTTPSANAIPYADVSGTLNDWISTASTVTFGKVKTSNSSSTVISNNDLGYLNSFTGGTYTGGTLSLTNNSGSTFTITGFSQNLETTLGYGNSSGIYNISMGTGTTISSDNGGGQIQLDYTSIPNTVYISTDYGVGSETSLSLNPIAASFGSPMNNFGIKTNLTSINYNDEFKINGLYNTNSADDVILSKDNASVGIGSASGNKPAILIGTESSYANSGVVNSVIVGGTSVTASQSNTLYSSNFNIFSTPTNNNSNTEILSRNSSTGNIEYTSLSYITGGTGLDVFVTGGTYVTIGSGSTQNKIDFTNTTGGTFTVKDIKDTYLTGATFTSGTTFGVLSLQDNSNTEIKVTNVLDRYVTGGTYNNSTGTATFTNNIGNTFNVTGFSTGGTSGTDVFVTGVTYSNNTFTYTNNTGGTFSVLFNTVTGLTVNGNLNITGTTSSGIVSATTYQNLPIDIRITGGTYDNTTGTATFTNNTGGTFNVTGFSTGGTGSDTYVTGLTYSSNVLTLSQNQGQPNLTATIGLRIKSGTVTAASFTGTPRKYTVTFSTAYPSTSYSIGITGSDNRTFTYESKTTTGFVINTNANTALTGNVDWQTIAVGES